MLRLIGLMLAALVVLGAVLPAAAAPRHRDIGRNPPADPAPLQSFYDNLDRSPASPSYGSPANPGTAGDRCLPSGPPCRTRPDGW